VDTEKVPCLPRMSPLGFPIFIQEFEIIYIYGGTAEIKAQMAWKEDVRLCDIPLYGLHRSHKLSSFPQGVEKR